MDDSRRRSTHSHPWVRHCGIGRLYSPPPVRSQTRNRLAAHQKLCLARMTRTFITISSDEAHASNLRENHNLLSPNPSRQYWAQQSAVRRHIGRTRRHYGEPRSYRVPLNDHATFRCSRHSARTQYSWLGWECLGLRGANSCSHRTVRNYGCSPGSRDCGVTSRLEFSEADPPPTFRSC
jgi:hypothetical protein